MNLQYDTQRHIVLIVEWGLLLLMRTFYFNLPSMSVPYVENDERNSY